jgi:hypothetical protein
MTTIFGSVFAAIQRNFFCELIFLGIVLIKYLIRTSWFHTGYQTSRHCFTCALHTGQRYLSCPSSATLTRTFWLHLLHRITSDLIEHPDRSESHPEIPPQSLQSLITVSIVVTGPRLSFLRRFSLRFCDGDFCNRFGVPPRDMAIASEERVASFFRRLFGMIISQV